MVKHDHRYHPRATDPESAIEMRGAAQRLRIMEATEEVIRDRGVAATRLRDIAKRADVSIGMVQHYFDSKDALLSQTFHHRNQRRAHDWGAVAAPHDTAWEKIEALITNAVDANRIADSAPIYLEFCAASSRDDELRTAMADSYNEWRQPTRQAIEQGISEGAFKPTIPPEDIVNILAMMLDGAEIAVTLRVADPPAKLKHSISQAAAHLLGWRN